MQRLATRAPGARAGRPWRSCSARSSARAAAPRPRTLARRHSFVTGLDARRLRDDVLRHRRGRAARRSRSSEFADAYQRSADDGDRRRSCGSRARPATPPADDVAVPVRVAHAPVRHADAATSRLPIADGGARATARRLVALARVPRPAPRRAAQPQAPRCRARAHAARARRQRAGRSAPAGEPATGGSDAQLAARRSREARCSAPSGRSPPRAAQALEAQGVPAERDRRTSAGSSWRSTNACAAGPAASCSPGTRVLADARSPHARAAPVRTTVSPALQRAAVTALGGQLGGIVAMQPSTGQILAVAGLGLDGLQPPGSTFKMVTRHRRAAGGDRNPADASFPYATYATLDGVELNNANGEECGGTLELAFAVSCNSVFTPLGVKLGAARLVATAERFGFNHRAGIPGAAESTLPPAARDPGRTRRRLDGDRPGRGARERAGDGDRGRDDRRRRAPPAADVPAGQVHAGARRWR